ncbi:MAG: glycosyltransferase family 4 protein [Betaproteobacteria bacterium]|jgi:glycosyltransferase involved in cell wall biosynthesis|nr:glycosyltransferase family 4 protein [Betaproteobacteria bacterium]
MKILVLTNLFPSPWDPLRGPFNRQQFERLGASHEVDVLTAVDFRLRSTRQPREIELRGVHADYFVFVYPPRIGRSLHALFLWLSLMLQRRRKLRNGGYDCILASWAYPDAVAARRVARWLGIPYVVKVHGSDLNVQAEFALKRPQIRSALSDAGAVVAVSKALADKAVAIGAPAERVHVIYNGVDTALFSPGSCEQACARLGRLPAKPLILFVGNLKASKGCMDLLGAFPELLKSHPNARLVYIGSGPCRSDLLRRADALGCTSQLELLGAIAHTELADWFRAADVLCLPSYNEGVPNVVLEAMACGTPVVATHVGGIPEIVPDFAGLLVPAADHAALADALIQASNMTWDHGRIADHAATFKWEDNVSEMTAILSAVIDAFATSIGAST